MQIAGGGRRRGATADFGRVPPPHSPPMLLRAASWSAAAACRLRACASSPARLPFSSAPPSPGDDLKACVAVVQRDAPLAYHAILALPAGDARECAFAVQALVEETGRAAEAGGSSSSGEGLALARLGWWASAVDSAMASNRDRGHAALPASPYVRALALAAQKGRLSRRWAARVVEARVRDVENGVGRRGPVHVGELEQLGDDVHGSALLLTLQGAGVASVAADHAASHVGKATGACLALRHLVRHGARRRTYVPRTVLARNGLTQEALFRAAHAVAAGDARGMESAEFKGSREKVAACASELALVAREHLEHAKAIRSKASKADLPQAALAPLFPAALLEVYLDALEADGWDALRPIAVSPAANAWALLRAWGKGSAW